MSEESVPKLTKAPIPVQTHTLKVEERIAKGKALSESASRNMFLGWATGTGRDKRQLYIRQLRDAKIKPVIEIMKPLNLKHYAGL